MEWVIVVGALVSWVVIARQARKNSLKRKMTLKEESQYEIKG